MAGLVWRVRTWARARNGAGAVFMGGKDVQVTDRPKWGKMIGRAGQEWLGGRFRISH